MGKEKPPSRARLVLLLWIAVALFYAHLASNYIQVVMRDDEFGDYVEFVTERVGRQRGSAESLRKLVDAKARELSLPIDEMDIQVEDSSERLGLTVNYAVNIDFPLIPKITYHREFTHTAAFANR